MPPENHEPNMNAKSSIPLPDSVVKATSELNNLLQIISGTSSLLDHACKGNETSEKYLSMLHASVLRAENVAAELVRQAGGPDEKVLMNPDHSFARKTTSQSTEKKKISILLVDDEQMTLALVARVLGEAGYQVTTAQSGFECLDHVRRRPYEFDLVLLDLTMPFMDGEETFDRLRELRSDLAVVMCTGFIQQERLQRLMAAGLAGFLRKPLSPDEIVGHVRSTLAGAKYSRDQVGPNNIPAIV